MKEHEINWTNLEKFLADGGEPESMYAVDQTVDFDKEIEPYIRKIFKYCRKNKIPFAMGFALARSNEPDDDNAEVGTAGRSVLFIPENNERTVCEIASWGMIMNMPHSFTHFIMDAAAALRASGILDDDDEFDRDIQSLADRLDETDEDLQDDTDYE